MGVKLAKTLAISEALAGEARDTNASIRVVTGVIVTPDDCGFLRDNSMITNLQRTMFSTRTWATLSARSALKEHLFYF